MAVFKRYMVTVGDEDPKEVSRVTALGKLMAFLVSSGSARDWPRVGEEPAVWESKTDTFVDVFNRLGGFEVGQGQKVRRKSDRQLFEVRRVQDVPEIVDLGIAPQLEVIVAFTRMKHGSNLRDAGFFVCRVAAGSSSVSRHGYKGKDAHDEPWAGAAWDIFVVNGGMDELERVALSMVRDAINGKTNPSRLIVGDRQWRPESGWTPYTGIFHRHIHVEVNQGAPCM